MTRARYSRMPRHKLRFLPRYRSLSPLVVSNERTEHRCAFMLCAAIPSLKARTGVRSLALIIRSDDERGEKDQTPSRHAKGIPSLWANCHFPFLSITAWISSVE